MRSLRSRKSPILRKTRSSLTLALGGVGCLGGSDVRASCRSSFVGSVRIGESAGLWVSFGCLARGFSAGLARGLARV
eukprot:823749-Prorocentrum_minimum.AAC.1